MTQMSEVVVFRVDRDGSAVAASPAGERWISRSGTTKCHRLVGAKTLRGKPVCTANCASELAKGTGEGRCAAQVSVRGEIVRLNCHHVGEEAVVIVESTGRPAPRPCELLTDRERDVLTLVARGMSTNAVAAELGLKNSTVRTHVEHLCRRLGVRTRAQAVALAGATGQLDQAAAVG